MKDQVWTCVAWTCVAWACGVRLQREHTPFTKYNSPGGTTIFGGMAVHEATTLQYIREGGVNGGNVNGAPMNGLYV